MNAITIDGQDEDIFRRSIEQMLREGDVDLAAEKLRVLIEPYAGPGNILPSRFLDVTCENVSIDGWESLGSRIGVNDRAHHRISAIGISVAEPEEGARAGSPYVETAYYTDDIFPFSASGREDLLDGYSIYGSTWAGEAAGTEALLSVSGLEDLYRAVARLEAHLLATPNPHPEGICAGSLASCYLTVLIHQAVRNRIVRDGLPRPICILAGNTDIYPYFDAPVISTEECRTGFTRSSAPADEPVAPAPAMTEPEPEAANDDDEEAEEEEVYNFSRLHGLVARHSGKKPVMVLARADAEAATRYFELGGAQHMAGTTRPENADVEANPGFDMFDADEDEAEQGFAGAQDDEDYEPIPAEWLVPAGSNGGGSDGSVDTADAEWDLPEEPEASTVPEASFDDAAEPREDVAPALSPSDELDEDWDWHFAQQAGEWPVAGEATVDGPVVAQGLAHTDPDPEWPDPEWTDETEEDTGETFAELQPIQLPPAPRQMREHPGHALRAKLGSPLEDEPASESFGEKMAGLFASILGKFRRK